jgi:hypothetical protein
MVPPAPVFVASNQEVYTDNQSIAERYPTNQHKNYISPENCMVEMDS